MLDAAVTLARLGWCVLPLREHGSKAKAPYIQGGYKAASGDVEQVRLWWSRYPSAMVGVRPPRGVVVVDIDPRNGGSMEAIEALNGVPLPRTLAVRTGRGGIHLYYRYDPSVWTLSKTLRRPDGSPVAGVDVLTGATGFVVAPPSIHPDTGKPYEWANTRPIADLPQALLRAATTPARPVKRAQKKQPKRSQAEQAKGARGLIRWTAQAREGERNNRLFSVACTLFEESHPSAVFDDLARAAMSTGLPEDEVWTTIDSARAQCGKEVHT